MIKNASLIVYNIIGSKVIEENLNANKTSVNISSLNKGMYFLQVNWNEENYTQRFIKE